MPFDENKITITVKLHAILSNLLAQEAKTPVVLSLPAGAIVSDIQPALGLPKMEMVYTLNNAVTDSATKLNDGDHVDVIPAISGGLCAVGAKV